MFTGLTSGEAKEKLLKYGLNEIKEVHTVSKKEILLRQVKGNYLILLLFLASVVSFLVSEIITSIVIIINIIFMILFGFFQEYKAEKAIAALKNLLTPTVLALRNNKETTVDVKELVPDDIIFLRDGSVIPADCIILVQKELEVNEAVLTGESLPVQKTALQKEITNKNLIYMGTHVVNGKCTAKVLHTGMNTKYGKIAYEISTIEKDIPLKHKVNKLATIMAVIAVSLSIVTGLLLLIQATVITKEILVGILLVVISLTVSCFPEGFPIVLTIALAAGTNAMAKKNAIVNRMSSVEAMGSVTVIATDKTGTITKGEMTATKIFVNDQLIDVSGSGYSKDGKFFIDKKEISPHSNYDLNRLLKAVTLCNDASIALNSNNSFEIHGSPTEASLLVLSSKANFSKDFLYHHSPKIDEILFTSEKKFMSTLHKTKTGTVQFYKGAFEKVIEKCSFYAKDKRKISLTPELKKSLHKQNEALGKQGLRVLAIAYKENVNNIEDSNFIFLGLVALSDPPREEVKDSLLICQKAGIRVIMLTGDNEHTAAAIASQIGLTGKTINGDELTTLNDEELAIKLKDTCVFARINPEHKLRIVRLLKNQGETVAMTGDGINDAPALKEADVGIAMGIKGTDVSREVSDIVLKDDNFSSIVSAIEGGRTIFSNIRKFTTYYFSCNYAELFIIVIALILGFPLPLLALQILFMNMVTDDLPALTLAFNPKSSDVMEIKPRPARSNILNKHLLFLIIILGTVMGIGSLIAFNHGLSYGLDYARTMAFFTLIFFQVFNAFSFRSFRKTIFHIDIFKNKWLLGASLISISSLFIISYTPLNKIFGVIPLAFTHWFYPILMALSIIIIADIIKLIYGKKSYLFYN
ncbi:HAD-IC family P-type ATPase [Candidatus Woesearchaeota archaeon]|nr:HAD-IC family P-type ATPase [Candidatus Woesearchaeota archaeon]